MIIEGQTPPDFSLINQNGQLVSLQDFAGQKLVIYFYPKDDTPGCTKQACGFRDLWADIEQTGTAVVGISADNTESHQRFINKYNLPFTLLSDPDRRVMTEYGAFGEKLMYGKKIIGVIRSTVLVGKDGKVVKHWQRVANATTHPQKILELLSQG